MDIPSDGVGLLLEIAWDLTDSAKLFHLVHFPELCLCLSEHLSGPVSARPGHGGAAVAVFLAVVFASPADESVEALANAFLSEKQMKKLYGPHVSKLVFGVSDQTKHKPGCTATEDG